MICLVITHAAFDPARVKTLNRLLEQLGPTPPGWRVHVAEDHTRQGSLRTWLDGMHIAMAQEFYAQASKAATCSHIVRLPDDAIVSPGWFACVEDLIRQHPTALIDMYPNTPKPPPGDFYVTQDGCVGFTIMPTDEVREHLMWRMHCSPHVKDDEGLNLWAMSTGRVWWKCALVDHDEGVPSLDGNDAHAFRRPAVAMPAQLGPRLWAAPTTPPVQTYTTSTWNLVHGLDHAVWDIEAMYARHRGTPLARGAHIFIATPAYGAIEPEMINARDVTIERTVAEGIQVSSILNKGDSLVTRARNRLVHAFMKSDATHLMFWDADVEPLGTDYLIRMLAARKPVLGGAYPFKRLGGDVVFNLHARDRASDTMVVDETGCFPVADLPTGFMMIERHVIAQMMKSYPELRHHSNSKGDAFEPLWALFDTGITEDEHGNRVYDSEDYFFCRLWQKLGGETHVWLPGRFRHWGRHGFEGSVEETLGLEAVT
jgi:hypothetical protein